MQRHNHFSSTKTNPFCLIVTKRDVNVAKVFLQDRMVLYFVVSFGDVRTWLPCYRKNTNQRCQSMTDRSVFDYITIDIDGVDGVHVGNAFRSVLSDFSIPRLSKTQDRSQLVRKSHYHIRLRVVFPTRVFPNPKPGFFAIF